MKSFAFFGVLSIVALVACAPPTPPARVAAAPTPVKYVPPQTGLNNSGLDTTLPTVLDKVVKTALEEAVAPGVAIALNGTVAHVVPLLTDAGLSPASASNRFPGIADTSASVAASSSILSFRRARWKSRSISLPRKERMTIVGYHGCR